MVGFCPGEQPLWACFVTSPCTIPPEARCQADRGINAGGSAKTLDTYVTILLDKNNYPVISNVETYIMEHKHFYDSEWHLNDEGARIRTENLANDIKAFLSDPTDY